MGALGPVGLGLGLAGSALNLGLGVAQAVKGAGMKPVRPTYEIPEETKNQLALRQQMLNSRMAGAREMERNIAASAESARYNQQQAAQSPNQLLAASAASQGTTNRALRDLQMREAQDYQNRVMGLERAQDKMAAARDKQFKINEMDPFMDEAATKAALTEGGIQNIAGGLSSASAQFGKMYEMEEMNKSISDMINKRARDRAKFQAFRPLPSNVSPLETFGQQSLMDSMYRAAASFNIEGNPYGG
jgi:hypothetical protein